MIRSEAGTLFLEAECGVEEAELLSTALQDPATQRLDWRGCTALHAACLQVLLAANRPLAGPPAGAALAQFVATLLPAQPPEEGEK